MIKVTTLNGCEMYLNADLIETVAETPDTLITLSNGKHYLVRESARVVVGRIVSFKARAFEWRTIRWKTYMRRNKADSLRTGSSAKRKCSHW